MHRYVIERDIPSVGAFDRDQLRDASTASHTALSKLAPRLQWEHSYIANDKTFCVYLAEDEAAIHEHAKLSGIPASGSPRYPRSSTRRPRTETDLPVGLSVPPIVNPLPPVARSNSSADLTCTIWLLRGFA
jgi:hypothetical protein